LKGLLPNPPKVILPIPIATSAPTITIHIGRLLGRFIPNNRPVTIAEPSLIEGLTLRIYLEIAHSINTHDATLLSNTTAEPIPKYIKETNMAGISAMTTPYIFFSTVSFP
jgi:hypothetical protein